LPPSNLGFVPLPLPRCLIQDPVAGGWRAFRAPRETVIAQRLEEVLPALREIERRVERERLWAAGFLAYEAGPAFDRAVRARPAGALPLLWFGLYDEPSLVPLPPRDPAAARPVYRWTASVDRAHYDGAIARIRELIAAGDTYQVNYTLRLRAPAEEPPEALFLRMVQANEPRYSAWLDCGRFVVCSASPELFLRRDGERLESRPMKGTTGRGLWAAQDEARAQALARSPKNRAENVMIVDMVRNDLGRISEIGSVRVPSLFELERYPTLWQMTSTVTARSSAPFAEVLCASFPPASITGAPKGRTTEIIAELETTPRGVYTGAIGYIAPGRRAQFNVAIRTALFDREQATVEYGVGGGIVWDSTSQAEYEECLLKARIVTDAPPEFSMLETMLWEPEGGYFLLDEHLRRLTESSGYLGARVDVWRVRAHLAELAKGFGRQRQRLRLVVSRDGEISSSASALDEPARPVRLAIAAAPLDPANPFLYNKTTYRRMYDEAKASRPGCDDVVLWNDRGEVTETTIANLVVELGGRKLTPPVECGLLPGVFRGWLLARGEIAEARITLDDLRRASRVWTINSVRKWRDAVLVKGD